METIFDITQIDSLTSGTHTFKVKSIANGSTSEFSDSVSSILDTSGTNLGYFRLSDFPLVGNSLMLKINVQNLRAHIDWDFGNAYPSTAVPDSIFGTEKCQRKIYCKYGYIFANNVITPPTVIWQGTAGSYVWSSTSSTFKLETPQSDVSITFDNVIQYTGGAKTVTLTSDSYSYKIYDGMDPETQIDLGILSANQTKSYTISSGMIQIKLNESGTGWYGVSLSGDTGTVITSDEGYDFAPVCQLPSQSTCSISISYDPSCFLPDTLITLADGTQKQVKDIEYTDKLKVWNFDEGHYDVGNICWLTKVGSRNDHYYKLTFSDGTILKTTGKNSNHKIYNVDERYFKGVAYSNIGDRIYTENGIVTIVNKEYISEYVEYYNLITSQHFNCFANGVLTSDRYNNVYPIDSDMVYEKDERPIRPYSEFEAVGINKYWYDNFRLGEQTESLDSTVKYIKKCETQMRPLPENYDPMNY